MPHGTALSTEEKAKIIAYRDTGMSFREIGRRLNRHHVVVCRFLADPQGYGKSNSTRGRKSKLGPREKRLIVRSASNKATTLREIRDDLQLNVSRETVRQVLQKSGTIVSMKMKKAPRLTATHIQARLNFAYHHLSSQTNFSKVDCLFCAFGFFKVIWSDEKKWSLDGPDGNRHYWHDLRKKPRVFSKRGFGGGSVMVWAAFCADGTVGLQFITSRMNSTDYQAVLTAKLLPFLATSGVGYVFQHDNAPIHASASTSQWLTAMNVRVMNWPACSPDLNPIENLWGILVRRVYANLPTRVT